MKGNLVLHLNNAMFSLGAARLKLRAIKDDDTEAKLADITNQIRTVADEIWDGDNAYEQAEAFAEQGAEFVKASGEPIMTASQVFDKISEVADTVQVGGVARHSLNIIGGSIGSGKSTYPSDAAFKKVDKLFFLDEWEGIKSIEPATIIGKTTLITFNVNTRQLAKYTAGRDDNLDLLGLDVKGSTIKNLDHDMHLSYSKTVRHPEDMIVHISRSDDATATYKLAKINAVPKPLTGRINKHTLLLKAW